MPIFNSANLKKLEANQDVKGLIRVLELPDNELRRQAALILAGIGETAIPQLHKALRNSEVNARVGAAMALSGMKTTSALPALSEGLKDTNRLVRLECARGFGHVKSASALTTIKHYYQTELDPEIRAQLIESMARLGDRESIQNLIKFLESDDYNTRMYATQSLINLGESAMDYLLLGLKSFSPAVRFACANALGNNKSIKAIVPLIQLLVDEDEGVQLAAQKALIHNKSDAAQYLALALKTKEQKLLQAVFRTLSKMPEEAESQIIRLIDSYTPEQQEIALNLLGQIGTRASLSTLSKYLKNSNSSIRYACVHALERLCFEESIPCLAIALNDDDEYVAQAASIGLRAIIKNTRNPQSAQQAEALLGQREEYQSKLSIHQQVIGFIEELQAIAITDGFVGEGGPKFDSLSRHIRAREIGIQLFQMGGHRLMQTAWSLLETRVESSLLSQLMYSWKEIGGWHAL